MSLTQRRGLALWAALLSTIVCLGFLPATRTAAVLILLVILGLIAAVVYATGRRARAEASPFLDNLPEPGYRQPVVLVCGDLLQAWPEASPVLIVAQGCWIRVDQDVDLVARQLLWQRPDWGRQLSVMVSVCPQKHDDIEALASRLRTLRWQISQLRRETRHAIPLVLAGQAGSAMVSEMRWQVAVADRDISVWRDASAPDSLSTWLTAGGAPAMQQQVLMSELRRWVDEHIGALFLDENPDTPAILPAAVIWGMGPALTGCLKSSLWTAWLSRRTAIRQVTGWHPVETDVTATSRLPDFALPLLPAGQGVTSGQRTWRCGLVIFTFAAAAALLSSGWHNRQLLHRLSFDLNFYNRIAMDDYRPKAAAVTVLREDAALLDNWARNGEPLRMSLGLYQGGQLRLTVLNAIRSYVPPPPPPPPKPQPEPVPKVIRLDSLSLFDSGKSLLKTGSTKMLVNSLVGIKARPGWLIVVAGHTDNTGNPTLNQTLSLQRAEAVRDWMRDTGDVPESCFAVQGYGDSRPVATNDTEEGRALNRRVEISLVPQVDACQIPDNTPASSQDDDALQQNGE